MSLWEAKKIKGNEEFKKKNYAAAVGLYTEGISLDPSQDVLYSNRGLSYMNLNEPEKSNGSRRGMIEYPKNNIIKEKLKGGDNDKNNNSINISFKSGDWDVRNENSINQIDIKSNSSKNKPNDEPKNITMSDFEESFREENVPKKI